MEGIKVTLPGRKTGVYSVQSNSDSGIMGKETLNGRNLGDVGNFT